MRLLLNSFFILVFASPMASGALVQITLNSDPITSLEDVTLDLSGDGLNDIVASNYDEIGSVSTSTRGHSIEINGTQIRASGTGVFDRSSNTVRQSTSSQVGELVDASSDVMNVVTGMRTTMLGSTGSSSESQVIAAIQFTLVDAGTLSSGGDREFPINGGNPFVAFLQVTARGVSSSSGGGGALTIDRLVFDPFDANPSAPDLALSFPEFDRTSVPEPQSILLVALALFSFVRRRR